ncbi:uncharacterized protein EI97DRAFT_202007 [Westerdykella ornata]|uniref:C3H1-type domain-containing protein n=1 Tax=Westerdykella ornata TaxID=318751 RepID=A0A6A6J906_WESOR|nr:uncharacterized protein EI97DRAFT_202007 [Westerdykella ornata]KAF2272653.1 hypothetical protein EI97DRAFT_202007 [Westerdykella ornata]
MALNNYVMSPLQSLVNSSSPDVVDDDGTSNWARYQRIIECDNEKTALLQELLQGYDHMNSQRLRELQMRKYYEDYARSLQLHLEKDPFVILLIDGDGMIFREELIQAGEEGGRKAAQLLHQAILNHIHDEMPNILSDVKVVCRIYANVRGLADTLVRVGAVPDIDTVEQFTRGFTRGRTLFDFVDVGPGKDRADSKIIETFKLYLRDFHCRQIYFGCSHDNGYARTLEEHTTGDAYVKRITLLEGVPFEKELLSLPFATKKFPDIFRDTKLSLGWRSPAPNNVTPGNSKNYNMFSGLPSRFPPPRQPSLLDSPFQPPAQPNFPRTPSVSTLASSDGWSVPSKKPTPVTTGWAAVAAAPAPPPPETTTTTTSSPTPTYKPANRDELIARNRHGQRVDPPCRDYDKAEVDRIKKIKLCNVHFLRGPCPHGPKCAHLHDWHPTRDELATLRLVARMAPCQNGSGCEDAKCIYGHRCPAPRARNGVKGTRSCIFGEKCVFSIEMHDVECTVVKTLVIR